MAGRGLCLESSCGSWDFWKELGETRMRDGPILLNVRVESRPGLSPYLTSHCASGSLEDPGGDCPWLLASGPDICQGKLQEQLGYLDLGAPPYADFLLFPVSPLPVPSEDGLQDHLLYPAKSQTLWYLQPGVPELTVELG